MSAFTERLVAGWERASRHLALALVPFVTALLNTRKIEQVLQFDGQHVGFKLGLPVGVVDVWQFTSVPNTGVTVSTGLPVSTPAALLFVPLGIAVKAGLLAGYFGSLRDVLATDAFDFAANARTYFWEFLLYELVPLVLVGPLVLLAMQGGLRAAGPLFVVLFPAIIVGSYLFFATPYLLVLHETGLVPAAKRSYALATAGGPYLGFALRFAALVLAVSAVVTVVVVNLGPLGIVLGTIGVAPVGVALNLATMEFVADLEERLSAREQEGGSGASPVR
ncbi:hypothetical protein ACFR9U_05645 [Halorientalis brevis]|uniref:Uncharacterized protein n=1 Tax=Halorientalis brevis TaxID=1126241 RepID=A0ABD6C9S7_9EURY|nr:hypothetical protein [Halorientalis brevis]